MNHEPNPIVATAGPGAVVLAGQWSTKEKGEQMKPTKYVKVFVIQGSYPGPHGWEDECCDTDRTAMRQELRNYHANSPYPARLICRRVLRENYETGNF